MFVWCNDGHNKYVRNSRSNKLKIANWLNGSSSETKSDIPTSALWNNPSFTSAELGISAVLRQ